MDIIKKDLIGEVRYPKVRIIKTQSGTAKNGVPYLRLTAKAKEKSICLMVYEDNRKFSPYKRLKDSFALANEWQTMSFADRNKCTNLDNKFGDAVFLKETLLTIVADEYRTVDNAGNVGQYYCLKDWGYGINDISVRKMLLKNEVEKPDLKVSLKGFGM